MGATPSKNAPKTVIIGANGCVGIATLESLMMRSDGELDVYAGVRDTKKFEKQMIQVPTIHTDMGNRRALTKALQGFDRVFVVVPCDRNRTGLATIALEAAKAAGVKFVLMLSVTIANFDTIFGRQFKPIEDRTKSIGIPYTIIRLPLFMDNNFAHASTVARDNMIYDPKNPRQQFACVSVEDVGKCAAEILRNPERHYNKTYNLVSQKYSMIDLSISMSKILRRQIKVKEISYNRFKEALQDNKVPEWQIDGLIEWLRNDFDRRINEHDLGRIENITGDRPATIDHFVATNALHFGWSMK
jgi:NAD(P)H dehydrogenase (quinone)